MSTDPKKNDEIQDEELDKVSGGAESDRPDEREEYPHESPPPPPPPPRRAEKI